MTNFNIRTAIPGDARAVSALLYYSYSHLMPASYPKPLMAAALPFIARANPTLLASGTYYVVENETQDLMIGCGGWTAERPGTGELANQLGHIRHFATHPDWLSKGVGRMIYSKCCDEAQEASVKKFECYSSLNAEPFYVALGFEHVKPVDIQMTADLTFPSVLMVSSL